MAVDERSKFDIRELLEKRSPQAVPEAKPTPPPAAEHEEHESEVLAPLPTPGDAYKPHSRTSNRPLPMLFFLDGSMLPDGYSYSYLERVYFEEGGAAGAAPRLIVRFYGSAVKEAVIEGRNLLPLSTFIGRQLVHWVWEQPAGRQTDEDAATVIRKISFRRAGFSPPRHGGVGSPASWVSRLRRA